jgi:uncharacterized protein (DUF1501 family)
MLTRRQFLVQSLKGSSLVALSTLVPGFVATAAKAAPPGKDQVLVVLEMTGGNDGLNTVAPYADDLYQKARPTLRLTPNEVVKVDDYIGLNPGMRSLETLLNKGQLAIVQGVGYPNPDRSHFESMDIWQSADPRRQTSSGWLGRSMGDLQIPEGGIPGVYIGNDKLRLAMQGSATGVPTIHPNRPYELALGGLAEMRQAAYRGKVSEVKVDPATEQHRTARMRLIEEMAQLGTAEPNPMLQFVQRSALQTYSTIERMRQIMRQETGTPESEPSPEQQRFAYSELSQHLNLVARMIRAGFGTRIFYVSIDGFDTHARQRGDHENLLRQVADAITNFFLQMERSGDAQRVLLMTFSEFGRRIQENNSKGTDHGAASCLFVAGPAVKGGAIGKHPSLAKEDLDLGDLKHHTDFRQVYATLLDQWLGVDSQRVLGGKFAPIPLLK